LYPEEEHDEVEILVVTAWLGTAGSSGPTEMQGRQRWGFLLRLFSEKREKGGEKDRAAAARGRKIARVCRGFDLGIKEEAKAALVVL
jgi:hypothetical protein